MLQEKPIVIAYCRGSMVHGDFCHALSMLSMRAVAMGLWIGHQVLTTTLVDAGRNYIVDKARKMPGGFSHILMLDTDMFFPADTLERLLSHNVPFVAASYCMRMEPRCMVHRDLNMSSELPEHGMYENDLFPILSVGMGCVLIREDAFDSLDKAMAPDAPLFATTYSSRTTHVSEDTTFCRNLQRAGVPMFCDARLSRQVRHVGLYAYSSDDIQATRHGAEIRQISHSENSIISDGAELDPEIVRSHLRDWMAYPYGGGAALPLGLLAATEACAIVARDYGVVGHIDYDHGFVFYKPKGSQYAP
jgi:hypothetical protein